MGQRSKKYSDEYKARVALEAVRGVKTLSELSSQYRVHPTVIARWKHRLVMEAPVVFRTETSRSGKSEEELTAPLYEEIGRLKMEMDWLKKKS